MVKRKKRQQAQELRKQGMSVRDIAEQLNVSRGSVSAWVRTIQLSEEQKQALKQKQHRWGAQNEGAQQNREAALQQRLQYQQAGRLRARQSDALHLTGCMLYWAEGSKTKRNSVHFANSDPHMMLLFMRFLREEFDIKDELFRIQIHCHTHDLREQEHIKQYWLDFLQLPASCVYKVQVKKGSDSRKNRLPNGVCALQVHRTEIVQHIYGAIQEYGGFDRPEWLF